MQLVLRMRCALSIVFLIAWATVSSNCAHVNASVLQSRQHDLDTHRSSSMLVKSSEFAYTWKMLYEDPAFKVAWSHIDDEIKTRLEALFYSDRNRADVASSLTTAIAPTSQASGTNSTVISSVTAKSKQGSETSEKSKASETPAKGSPDREKLKEELKKEIKNDIEKDLKKEVEKIHENQNFTNEANKQDCNFGRVNVKSWHDVGAERARESSGARRRCRLDGYLEPNSKPCAEFHEYLYASTSAWPYRLEAERVRSSTSQDVSSRETQTRQALTEMLTGQTW